MANLSRDRSHAQPLRRSSLLRSAWGLLKLAIAVTLAAAAIYIIMATFDTNQSPNTTYTVIQRQLIAEELYRDTSRQSDLGFSRAVSKPTRYLLICQGNRDNRTTVFEVSRRDYEFSHSGQVFQAGQTETWRRFKSIGEATAAFDSEFTPPVAPQQEGESAQSGVTQTIRQLLGL